VTQVGDYVFRICFIDSFQGAVMAKFAAGNLKAKTAAILGDVNSDYSKGLTTFFEEEFTKLGGKIVAKEAYTQTDPDFKGQLTKIRNLNPDVIYIPGYYGQVGIIAKQARELDMTMPLLGGDGWDSPELWKLGGAALKNAYMSNHYSADNPAPEIQNFVKAYTAKFNVKPDAIAALAYDAAKILADAIKRQAERPTWQVERRDKCDQRFSGVTANHLDSSRNAVKPAVVLECDAAAAAFKYKETIAPEGSEPVPAANTASNTNTAAPANSNTAK
jgi:branched-chain amino acid transport system substrate-binding protein